MSNLDGDVPFLARNKLYRRGWPDLSEAPPVDVLPCSNDEYFPLPPSKEQIGIMRLQSEEIERYRRKFNMSRRAFVRTAAATAIGFWAIDAVRKGEYGNYGFAQNATTDACDLEWDGKKGSERLTNLPGEFIFDVQSHHVDPEGQWRITNPGFHAFFAAVWPQSSWALGEPGGLREDGSIRGGGEGGEVDPIQNLSRHHYLKELYLDSATTATVLSVVPTSPDTRNPLPLEEGAKTARLVNGLAKSKRCVLHAFVMPNRGSTGTTNTGESPNTPVFLEEEMQLMMERAETYGDLIRGWKTYCAWGDVPNASGWTFDTDVGMRFLEQVLAVSKKHPQIPPVVATHKGFALPSFDQRAAAPRDIGIAAKAYPGVRFIVYHSGYDTGDRQEAYPGDNVARSDVNKVDAFIKSLRENQWDASRFVKKGKKFGNVPNVWAELGSVWRGVMNNPDEAAHLLGKLITHVGPKRICWGTDSLWYGSPQPEIVALRRFEFTTKGREVYGLPYGLNGDVEDPRRKAPRPSRTIRNAILGYNAARAYNFDPIQRYHQISCDEVQKLKESAYVQGAGTERESAPLASHVSPGARTPQEVAENVYGGEWSP
jgi:predicted TIM-barrel fold metal-dependent hydrolase